MMNLDRRQVLAGVGCTVFMPDIASAMSSSVETALAAIGDARFVAIGERHDNPAHQVMQAALVAALQPAGIAFEMIPQDREDMLNRLRRDGATREEIATALDWKNSGWPDFSNYASIMEAAPDAYVAGGGLSRQTLAAIYTGGAAGLGEDMARRYGLDEPLAPDTAGAMLDEQYEAHCGLLDRERLGPMVEVQRAWDAAYAEAWQRAAVKGHGLSVLICGNAHARLQTGAPACLIRAVPDARVAAIGQTEEGDGVTHREFYTVTIQSPRPKRPDPCDAMRAHLKKDE